VQEHIDPIVILHANRSRRIAIVDSGAVEAISVSGYLHTFDSAIFSQILLNCAYTVRSLQLEHGAMGTKQNRGFYCKFLLVLFLAHNSDFDHRQQVSRLRQLRPY